MPQEIVQARMINEVLYCERLMYLERVQGEFEHNYFTVDGNAVHHRVDVPGGSLPPLQPTDLAEDRPYKARSVWLSSETLGIAAKIDVVEGSINGTVIPVEYKRGSPPDIPEGAYLPERAQVCAQVLLLREHGYRVEEAMIYFAASKKRVPIVIDDSLIAATISAAARVRALTSDGKIPPPLVDSPKCNGCSLVGICLPDETNFFTNVKADKHNDVRQIHPSRDDKSPLHVQEQGSRVGLSAECLVIRTKEKSADVPLALTSHVAVHGNVQVSTQALRELLYRNIPVIFFTTGGWYCGRSVGTDSKNVEVRLAQFHAAINLEKALHFARETVAAKVKNCRTILRRNGEPSILTDMKDDIARAENSTSIESLLGAEGIAAKRYFEHFQTMLRPPHSVTFAFDGRNRRPPRDPVNALLSLAYALLIKDFTIALHIVGLDPLIGLYHQPRSRRPSLTLDLMEPFRPIVADSVVLTAINTGVVGDGDFVRAADAVSLTSAGRRNFIQSYERRMDQEVTHPIFGYRMSYRRVIEVQARLFSKWLIDEIPEYPQFLVR